MINLYMDKKLELSSNQAITNTAESENVIDFGVKQASAAGKHIDFRIKETFQGGTSLQFVLQDSEDGVSFTDKVTTPAFDTAALKASTGSPFYSIAIPKGLRRYIRINYVVSGAFTSGKIHAIMNTDIAV